MKWQRAAPDAGHAFLDPDALVLEAPTQFARPVPTSNARMIQRAALGNIRFELPIDADCGYTDPVHLVVCLDVDYGMTAIESLRVLSFAADPVRVRAGSARALTVIRDLLATHSPKSEVELLRDVRCTGDCERRITLELQ